MLDDQLQLGIGLVARVIEQRRGTAVTVGHRSFGIPNRILTGLRTHMRQIHDHTDPIHFIDQCTPVVGKTAVSAFITAAADKILGVVGQLHHADPQRLEDGHKFESVLDTAGVLPAENDSHPVLSFGPINVACRVHRQQNIGVFSEP